MVIGNSPRGALISVSLWNATETTYNEPELYGALSVFQNTQNHDGGEAL